MVFFYAKVVSRKAIALPNQYFYFRTILDTGEKIDYNLASDRYGWLQAGRSTVQLNGEELGEGYRVQMPVRRTTGNDYR